MDTWTQAIEDARLGLQEAREDFRTGGLSSVHKIPIPTVWEEWVRDTSPDTPTSAPMSELQRLMVLAGTVNQQVDRHAATVQSMREVLSVS